MANQGRSSQSRTTPRPAQASSDDLDALLDAILGEDPEVAQQRAAVRAGARQRADQQRVDLLRSQQVEHLTDELRTEIRSLALRVQALSQSNELQVEQGRAIQELRQALRDAAAVPRPPRAPSPSFNAEVQFPSLQIKLVLAQAANLLHQADKEVMMLSNWAMLFAGVSIGASITLIPSVMGPYTTRFWIFLAIAAFALFVSLIFALLTLQARRRVARARRAMEESTFTRNVPIGS